MLDRRFAFLAFASLGCTAAACGGGVTTISTTSSSSGGDTTSGSTTGSGGNGGAGGLGGAGGSGTSSSGTGGSGAGSSSTSGSGAGGSGTGGSGTGGSGTGGSGTGGSGTGGASTTSSSSSSASSTSSTSSTSSSTSASSTSSSTSASSSSGGLTCAPPDALNGDVVTAPANQWTWVPVPGSKCRNGTATGFGVRLNPASTKVFIYLEGGGACFNGLSCAGNPSAYGSTNFNSWKTGGGASGIFDTTKAENPVKDWNAVYIPYCTGDVHAGAATGVNVPGAGSPQGQSFVGYTNVGLYMSRIVPTFAGATDILLTGVSAGGFGALYNYDRVAQDFCPKPVVLVDDSGPPMSDTYLTPCLQTRWRTLWGLNATLPADCPQANGPNGGGIVNAMTCFGTKYGTGRLGLISSNQDSTISQFYGFGLNNCANLDGFAQAMPGATYAAGLEELRSVYLSQSPAWGTYFVASTTHTYLGGAGFFNTTVMNVKLTTWLGNLVNGGPIADIGP